MICVLIIGLVIAHMLQCVSARLRSGMSAHLVGMHDGETPIETLLGRDRNNCGRGWLTQLVFASCKLHRTLIAHIACAALHWPLGPVSATL